MASSHEKIPSFALLIILISATVHTYVVPDVNIVKLEPTGLIVSIPDEPGVQFFTFHGEINKMISSPEDGSINGDINQPTNGQWVFTDSRVSMGASDVLHYWFLVQVDGVQHTKAGLTWTMSSGQGPGGGDACSRSVTVMKNGMSTCQGQLIFEENFKFMNSSVWTRDVKIPFDPDYEFCVYHNLPASAVVKNGSLHVIPSLFQDYFGNETIRTLELSQCTSKKPMECSKNATAYNIVPPAISARLTTASSFSFRYGRIEIRAKFPEGDWLYPEMWLKPLNSEYGEEYASGRVQLGLARGNEQLIQNHSSQVELGAKNLEFGLQIKYVSDVHNEIIRKARSSPWTTDFHVYSTTWSTTGFTFRVDGEEVGRMIPRSNGWLQGDRVGPFAQRTRMAPFDKEFYITLGVGVGGMREFPDGTTSGQYEKPWRNIGAKALLNFWQAKEKWLPSWQRNNASRTALEVDYVKVWAL